MNTKDIEIVAEELSDVETSEWTAEELRELDEIRAFEKEEEKKGYRVQAW